MINITIYENADQLITGFKVLGHAGYAKAGSDIVCSAVSAMVINTINSIEHFTSDTIKLNQDEEKGLIEFHVAEPISGNTNLLLSSLALGLSGIRDEYKGKYLDIIRARSR